MKQEIINAIYQDDKLLYYLRFHPKWYRILDEDEKMFESFLEKAKEELHLRSQDKIDNFGKQIKFISSMLNYLNKSK